MLRLAVISSFVVLALASLAHADAPLPWHQKDVQPWLRFEGIDEYPEKVFCLKYVSYSGNPKLAKPRLIEIKNSEAFLFHVQRRLGDMSLLVMDRGAFDPKAKEDPSLKWLNESSTGVKFVRLQKPHIVAFFLSESSPLTTYRVSLINGQPTVETIEPANSMVYIIAGVFGSMAVMLAGVWLFRRQKVVPAPVA